MSKETTINWNGLELTVHYEENGFPDVILKDVYCEDSPITFLEKVQECKDIVGEVAGLVSENWAEEHNETPDIFDKADYYFEMQNDK